MSKDPIISTRTDVPEFNARLAEWVRLTGRNMRAELRGEAVETAYWLAVNSRGAKPATPPDTKGQGNRAVKRDVETAVRPLTPAAIGRLFEKSEKTRDHAKKLLRDGDVTGLRAMFRGTYPGLRLVTGDQIADIHRRKRDRSGRVRERRAKDMTIDRAALTARVTFAQGGVGEARGGWSSILLRGNGKRKTVPQWVARHVDQGTHEDRSNDLASPSVTLTNRSSWSYYRDETGRVMRNALRGREASLRTKISREIERAGKAALK